MARPPKAIAVTRLQALVDNALELKQINRGSSEFTRWHENTKTTIIYTFGESSRHLEDFSKIGYSPVMAFSGMPHSIYQDAYIRGLDSAIAKLHSMIDEIRDFWDDDVSATGDTAIPQMDVPLNTSEVFVIHGRDDGTKNTVARFLEGLGVEPVILGEKPDEGRTIIEKFERYAQVNFAIALFTPDDVGGLEDGQLRPRTRQNVIFEFGYFIGKYGRDRVRALVKGDIEIPSDYSGVLYIPFDDSESWKMRLIGEMKSAGFEIDANRAFQ